MSVFASDDLEVRWLDGALLVTAGGSALLVDAPPGVTAALGAALPAVQSVVLTSGRIGSVGGLVELLAALAPHRRTQVPLALRSVLGEERGPSLAETWVRGWPDRYPLTLDAQLPGSDFDVGVVRARTVPLEAGEPLWHDDTVVGRSAVALRLVVGDTTVVWVPGAAPGPAVRRACRGATLAVVEIGVVPWPRTDRPWRLSLAEAVYAGAEADTLWVVGDDGRFVGDDDPS